MCGVCGRLGPASGSPDSLKLVERMMDRMVHRGPDDSGTVQGPGFALGHRRLSIIDLAHGKQPMQTEDGRYCLVFNGEIYNYIELRESLKSQGVAFQTNSDTEVLLRLLVAEGVGAFERLNGMFAFAFVDAVSGEWILGRDPFGIKPLYYIELADEIVFASEIKALLVHPEIRAQRNWNALEHYLTFQFCLNDQTLFKNIRQVLPGFYLQGVGANIDKTYRYWDTNYRIDEHHTEEYFTEQLQSYLRDSARLQIRSDVPVGAHLSGGIDSSTIASLASEHLGGSVKVFTGRFAEGPAYDESSYAKILAESIRAEYLEVVPTAQQFVDFLPKLIYSMDEPVAGPGLFPQFLVSRLASENVKVVLGGQGGDELFGGYARYLIGYLEQALKGAIFETQEEGKHLVTLNSIIENLPLLRQYRPLMQQFWSSGLFDAMDARYFQLVDRSPTVLKLLTPEARERLNMQTVFADFQKIFNHPDTASYINKMTHFDLKTLLPALLQVEDRVSMAVSLESRVPLLDTRIVDLVTSMPPPLKFQGGKTKYIFKQAVQSLLPEAIMNRKDKMGFPVPLKEWMAGGVVREFVSETLLGKASRERGLFDPQGLQSLIDTEGAFGRQLWGALCLELWHQTFIDAEAPA